MMKGASVLAVLVASSALLGCKTTSANNGAAFFAARDRADNPDSGSKEWRAQWLERNTYRHERELPVIQENDSCELMTVLIELPAIGPALEVGHTGVAIGNDYFDFGPVNAVEKSSTRFRAEGGPYWDHPESWPGARTADDVSFQMIRDAISTLAEDHTVLMIPMVIDKRHADAMRSWWKKTYETPPEYNIPGLHCTSSVIRGIEESDPARDLARNPLGQSLVHGASAVTSPLKYAQILLGNTSMNAGSFQIHHSCGSLKGQSVRAAVIHLGADLGGDASRLLLQNTAAE